MCCYMFFVTWSPLVTTSGRGILIDLTKPVCMFFGLDAPGRATPMPQCWPQEGAGTGGAFMRFPR